MSERPVERKEQEMGEQAERMDERLDELGDHIREAAKKAEVTRAHADPDRSDEPLGDVAGDWHDTAPTEDDPAGAIDDAPDSDR
jgi:hypothetical protein